jgi:AcrR family transcriptional regulator
MSGSDAVTRARATIGERTSIGDDFSRSHIGRIQRARLLGAMVHAAYELGASNVTVATVVERAGVSRRTFYELFSGCEDCLLAALEYAFQRVSASVLPVYEVARDGWRARIRACLSEMLAFFDEQPHIARLLIVEWLASGPRALERRRQVLETISNAIDEGRLSRSGSMPPPELAAEAIVGSVVSVLHGRMTRAERPERLLEMLNPLMSIIVLPYLGTAAARKELGRPLPKVSIDAGDIHVSDDPLKGLDIRITYRTMRVLAAIASHPGGSNRAIAGTAGIEDQGQISRLLMRLQKLGLVDNRGAGRSAKGEANAWYLTVKGGQVNALLGASPLTAGSNTA